MYKHYLSKFLKIWMTEHSCNFHFINFCHYNFQCQWSEKWKIIKSLNFFKELYIFQKLLSVLSFKLAIFVYV